MYLKRIAPGSERRENFKAGQVTDRKQWRGAGPSRHLRPVLTLDTPAFTHVAKKQKGSTFPAIPPGPGGERGLWGLKTRPGRARPLTRGRESKGGIPGGQGARAEGPAQEAGPELGRRAGRNASSALRGVPAGHGGLCSSQAAVEGPGLDAGPKRPPGSARGRTRLLTRADRPRSSQAF